MDKAEKFMNKRGRKMDNKLLLFMIISIVVFAVPDLMTGQGAQIAEQMLEERYGIIVEVPAELMKTCLLFNC
jgi:hypothetical protein